MDSSIWSPPENQDESCYPANCWQYNLYFDPWLDVIEQDALNEISCLQVLKILITKAYSEIAELEDEILMLQSQLVCACADKGSYDMCFAVLHKKIDNLESLLRALKNENEQPAETTLENRHASEQEAKEYSSKRTHKGVKAVQIHDKKTSKQFVKINMASIKSISGIKGQEVVCTEN
ncbi:uncharacterized protein LOC107784904 [Nicotiana tabacum]|uniref:Uncharacterized protein LOC107784904 n=3 Tax=Nicotiana tabacum TaxID=4097 RepID=A0AC58U3Q7_TOBAC|nr:PREDICTED: uncharacterized protein LOC107784904 [Nicotiana tabacum]